MLFPESLAASVIGAALLETPGIYISSQQRNELETVLRAVAVGLSLARGISSLVSKGSTYYNTIASKYGKDMAKAISEYGDNIEKIKAEYGDDVVQKAKKLFKEAINYLVEHPLNIEVKGAAKAGGIAGNKTLLSGSEWNKYFQETYGAENVKWMPQSFEHMIENLQTLYGCTQGEVAKILGDGWTASPCGNSGTEWKFINNDQIGRAHV